MSHFHILLQKYIFYRVEDNDDLVQLLEIATPVLRQKFGDYYIAEIIQNEPKRRCIIVAEVSN